MNTYSCEFYRLHTTGIHVGVAREKEGHVVCRKLYIPGVKYVVKLFEHFFYSMRII